VADPLELRARAGEIAAQAHEAYAAAAIVSVCVFNARAQMRAGAPRARVRVIPNGVTASDARPREADAFRVGFVGRVVPVKDLASFLRAAAAVACKRPRIAQRASRPGAARRRAARAPRLRDAGARRPRRGAAGSPAPRALACR
jgi:glycosyltransferase involved in cell wall biosynthesis